MALLKLEYSPQNASEPSTLLLPLGEFGRQPPFQFKGAQALMPASPLDACSALSNAATGALVLARRGNCTFVQKAAMAAAAGAAGLIIVNNDAGCLGIGATTEAPAPPEVSQLAVLAATQDVGDALLAALARGVAVTATWRAFSVHALGLASLLLLLLAASTVAVGAVWSGSDYSQKLSAKLDLPQQDPRSAPAGAAPAETVELNTTMVLAFVGMATVFMFIMFFVLNLYVFYLILAVFSWGSFVATATAAQAAAARAAPWTTTRRSAVLGLTADWLIAGAVSFVVVLTWLVNRHASWAWVLQNFLGVNFMVLALRSIQLPNTCVATIFLGLLFCYDIFMVFITPLFMPNGESVMIRVAQGGSAHEIMPMLLVMPRFFSPIHTSTMLGYGDVVVPGLLIALLRRFDLALGLPLRHSYFVPGILAYVTGLLLTYAALEFEVGGSQGQPALLYLVPCTLGTALALSAWRHHFWELWKGELMDDKDSGADHTENEMRRDDTLDTATSTRRTQGGGADDETVRLL